MAATKIISEQRYHFGPLNNRYYYFSGSLDNV